MIRLPTPRDDGRAMKFETPGAEELVFTGGYIDLIGPLAGLTA